MGNPWWWSIPRHKPEDFSPHIMPRRQQSHELRPWNKLLECTPSASLRCDYQTGTFLFLTCSLFNSVCCGGQTEGFSSFLKEFPLLVFPTNDFSSYLSCSVLNKEFIYWNMTRLDGFGGQTEAVFLCSRRNSPFSSSAKQTLASHFLFFFLNNKFIKMPV